MKRFLLLSALAAFAAAPYHAGASIQAFTNKEEFLARCAATNYTGTLPQLGLCPGGAAGRFTAGRVTFTITAPSAELYSGDTGGDDFTLLMPGPDIAISGPENLNAQFDGLVYSAGFDFVEPSASNPNCSYFDSTFAVTLKRNAQIVGAFAFNAPNDIAAFVGVQSDLPFDRLEIRETIGGCDNEFFGQFYCGSVSLAPLLYIRPVGASQAELYWSTNATGFDLEAGGILPAVAWSPSTNAPRIVDGHYAVTVEATSERQFFRLHKP